MKRFVKRPFTPPLRSLKYFAPSKQVRFIGLYLHTIRMADFAEKDPEENVGGEGEDNEPVVVIYYILPPF